VQTLHLDASDEGIARAAELLRAGGLVAFPTETVYGLGADATSDAAVASIYAAKGRPSFNPLIVHLAEADWAGRYADVSDEAEALMAAFWPGPLTLVLPRSAKCELAKRVSAGLDSVALRMPDHPVALAILRQTDLPLAAPSANPSGGVSPTIAAHVLEGLSGRIAALVDGGPCNVGVESTVLSLMFEEPRLLRPGAISAGAIAQVLGREVDVPGDEIVPTAPGQLASHYAPNALVILNASTRPDGALWLGFGPDCAGADMMLSQTGGLAEAATALFAALRTLDARANPGQVIAIAPIPNKGLGIAINDRLRRAASPR
jgi:L-threonylcarbamoyladenylate synthase